MVSVAKVSVRYSRRSNQLMAQINYKMFFTNMRAMTAIVSSMFAMIFMLFYEPVLTTYLGEQYHLSDEYFGMYLSYFILDVRLCTGDRLFHLRFLIAPGGPPVL